MYRTTVLEYLQVKYGVTTPTTMTLDDAKILGIPYPMRTGWLAHHGAQVIDMQTLVKLFDALGVRVERMLRAAAYKGKPNRRDVCLIHKKNLEGHFGEPIRVPTPPADVAPYDAPAAKRPTKAERRKMALEESRRIKPNTQVAAEIRAHRAKTQRGPRVGQLLVEGVDVRSKEFLNTYAWTRLRMHALTLYGRKCMCCGATPDDGAVMNVDHIKPRKTHPELALDIRNVQAICAACNKGKCNEFDTDWRTAAQKRAAEVLARSLFA